MISRGDLIIQVLVISLFSYTILGFGDQFGLYSGNVKSTFNMTQGDLDNIALAGFWPNLVGAAVSKFLGESETVHLYSVFSTAWIVVSPSTARRES